MNRLQILETALRNAIDVASLQIKDQSHLHAGHAGAQGGMGHFAVQIVSDQFDGMNRIQRHQLVYKAMGDLMTTDVHALSIRAETQAEASARGATPNT